jgi:hypothetical protein
MKKNKTLNITVLDDKNQWSAMGHAGDRKKVNHFRGQDVVCF